MQNLFENKGEVLYNNNKSLFSIPDQVYAPGQAIIHIFASRYSRVSVKRKVVIEFNYSWVVQLLVNSIFSACMSAGLWELTFTSFIALWWNVKIARWICWLNDHPTLTYDNFPSSHLSSSCLTGGFWLRHTFALLSQRPGNKPRRAIILHHFSSAAARVLITIKFSFLFFFKRKGILNWMMLNVF